VRVVGVDGRRGILGLGLGCVLDLVLEELNEDSLLADGEVV
jgi:hypothetical protein